MMLKSEFAQANHQKYSRAWYLSALLGAIVGIAGGYNIRGTVSIVDGTSMLPNFAPGARVFTTALSTSVERGDVVLVDDGRGEFALKRVVAMPGETIDLWRGYVFINGRMLVEPYLPRYTFTFPDQQALKRKFQLAPGEFFVLGDNRLESVDSRAYGPVRRECIKARVPESANKLKASFKDLTLPNPGKTAIQPILAYQAG